MFLELWIVFVVYLAIHVFITTPNHW